MDTTKKETYTPLNGPAGAGNNFASGRNFYIYGNVDDSMPRNIIAPFVEECEKQFGRREPQPINIYISSYGGRVDYGFDLIAQIERAKECGITINTFVTSVACSCGSLIAVTGTNRFVGERAYHLLHFMRGTDYAHNPEMLKRNYENGKFWQTKLVDIYKRYTKIKDIEAKLLADNYMVNGANQCIKLGLADFKY
jgi:ATP-dependent protease ClpP protease subunit